METISVPYPPSTNRLWRAVGGRNIKSEHYRSWLKSAVWKIAAQRPAKVGGPYEITITATRPDRRHRDLGNLEKPISDALVQAGAIDDDKNAQRIVLEWAAGIVKGGLIVVSIVKRGAEKPGVDVEVSDV